MVQTVLYTIISVIIVSLISLVGITTFLFKKDTSRILLLLVSLSVGTLLGGAFLHLLPEAVRELGLGLKVSFLVLAGFLIFFIIERFVHMHHCDLPESQQAHHHAYHLGIMNLVGDGVHNFIDGLVIAGSYLISLPLGIATTIAVVLHEIPQEIADFGVLLYSGMSKKRALFFNFLSATIAIIGAIVGLSIGARSETFSILLLPFAAGGFMYIVGSNLIPELHRECNWKESIWQLLMIIAGIGLMYLLLLLGVK